MSKKIKNKEAFEIGICALCESLGFKYRIIKVEDETLKDEPETFLILVQKR